MIREFDSLARYRPETQAEPASLGYGKRAERYPWFVRLFEGSGVPYLIEGVFGFERQPWDVEHPPSFARERIARMASLAGSDPVRIAETSWRLLLVLEADRSELNRCIATRQIESFLQSQGLTTVDERSKGLERLPRRRFDEEARRLERILEPLWPGLREEELTGTERTAYASALRELTLLGADSLGDERRRLRTLIEAVEWEDDAGLREIARANLRRATHSAWLHGLSFALLDPGEYVRERAVRALWTGGGGEILPWILARLADRARRIGAPTAPLDPSLLVRRRVLSCCGELSFAEAEKTSSAGSTEELSPLSCLQQAFTFDEDQGIRYLAAVALAEILGRPVDPQGAWIPAWWQKYVAESREGK